MKQDSISEQTNTEFDSLLAESISNSKLKEGTIIKGMVAEIERMQSLLILVPKLREGYLKENLHFRKIKKRYQLVIKLMSI